MSVQFTPFHALEQVADVSISGEFAPDWDGAYVRKWAGKRCWTEPAAGSGLRVTLAMKAPRLLPPEVGALRDRRGFVYVLASSAYPVLYVGICDGLLKSGVFARLTHHIRKLLAAQGPGTNHTSGWMAHARQRHGDIAKRLHAAGSADFRHCWEDVRVAIAHVDHPRRFEGSVLDAFERALGTVRLNTGAVERSPVAVVLPANLAILHSGPIAAMSVPGMGEVLERASTDDGRDEDVAPEAIDSIAGYEQYVGRMTDQQKDLFARMLAWARSGGEEAVREKVVRGFTGQPAHYNDTPVVNFSRLAANGRALPGQWRCRIPLEPTRQRNSIVLPLSSIASPQPRSIRLGRDRNFTPVDPEDFLEEPRRYVG